VSDERLPPISVVVPARESAAEIRACLASLRRLDYPRSRHEIIVVDGSENETAAILADHRVRNVTERRRGVAYARNVGIEASRSEVVAFTDTDCAVSTDWLRQIVEPFGDPVVGCVGGAIVPYPPETSAQRYAARRMSHSQLRPMSHPARGRGTVRPRIHRGYREYGDEFARGWRQRVRSLASRQPQERRRSAPSRR
jgi:cellulose synthase/poly-beta-1,6-N-acetylglucosamine synthase-like glycosyltransferase